MPLARLCFPFWTNNSNAPGIPSQPHPEEEACVLYHYIRRLIRIIRASNTAVENTEEDPTPLYEARNLL